MVGRHGSVLRAPSAALLVTGSGGLARLSRYAKGGGLARDDRFLIHLLFFRRLIGGGGRRDGVAVFHPAQVWEKGRNFKWHFVASGHNRHRRSLNHFHLVVPRIHFQAATQRQCRDLVQFVGL